MIYPEVIRADRFHYRKHLLAEDFRLQPQLVDVATSVAALKTKLKDNNNHACPFGSTNLLIHLLGLACNL